VNESVVESHLRFAEEIRPRLFASADSSVLEEVETRYAGLTEALEWLIEAGRADKALRLASTLVPFWMATKRIEDGDEWLTRCLGMADASAASHARGLYDHGYLVFWAGHYDVADDRFANARAEARELGDRDRVRHEVHTPPRVRSETRLTWPQGALRSFSVAAPTRTARATRKQRRRPTGSNAWPTGSVGPTCKASTGESKA